MLAQKNTEFNNNNAVSFLSLATINHDNAPTVNATYPGNVTPNATRKAPVTLVSVPTHASILLIPLCDIVPVVHRKLSLYPAIDRRDKL